MTITSPMKRSSFVARSRRAWNWKSSGVVVDEACRAFAGAERGVLITFSRNGRLVDTPRMRNSRSALFIRLIASSEVGAQAVTFTSSES